MYISLSLAKLLLQFLNPPVQIHFSSSRLQLSNCSYLCTICLLSNFIYECKDSLSILCFPPHISCRVLEEWETFLRFNCLICSWKLLLFLLLFSPLSIFPCCMSGNVFQENAKSLCHSPVNKIFAFPFAKRPKNFRSITHAVFPLTARYHTIPYYPTHPTPRHPSLMCHI